MINERRAVYFIEADNGLIKIGSAADPIRRFNAIRTGTPLSMRLVGCIPGAGYAGERELHARFAEYRTQGEWFRPSPELLAVVAEADPVPVARSMSSPAEILSREDAHRGVSDRVNDLVAAEVRAMMVRQRRTRQDLASVLGISAAQVGKRLDCTITFDIVELCQTAAYLRVSLASLLPPDLVTRARVTIAEQAS